MSETETAPEIETAGNDTHRDERLSGDFVEFVVTLLEEDQVEGARALVGRSTPPTSPICSSWRRDDARGPLAARARRTARRRRARRDERLGARRGRSTRSSRSQVAALATELDTDDAVAIIEDMDEDDRREVLRALDPDDRAAIEEALCYPEESAGRLMQRDLIAVPEHWTRRRRARLSPRATRI